VGGRAAGRARADLPTPPRSAAVSEGSPVRPPLAPGRGGRCSSCREAVRADVPGEGRQGAGVAGAAAASGGRAPDGAAGA
jgi:hypothetical protein